jgi:hypothetical protein
MRCRSRDEEPPRSRIRSQIAPWGFPEMPQKKISRRSEPPDELPLNRIQAERLSQMTGASIKDLIGTRPIDLSNEIKWAIDPLHWFYRRVCGRVVKKDPVTGAQYGVPHATVHVEDTDCSLILYSPVGSKLSWLYPFNCRREELATVQTDDCGRFCVWIPRWDIDWILSWRKRRRCFPDIFERPSLKDLGRLELERRPPFGPPDPGPLRFAGLERASRSLAFGESTDALELELGANAFEHDLHPPLPEEFVNVVGDTRKSKDGPDLITARIADEIGLDAKRLEGFDLATVHGPFLRCVTEIVPVWYPIFDVPDITFRVTQDVDGDGTEETIYGETFFQVRWDAGAIGPVTLQASSLARETRFCDAPTDVPCNNVPAITHLGLMPATPAYHNNTTGYAIRPNRPRPGGIPTSPATAPYSLNVNLFGCLPRVAGATQYRVVARYATSSSATFTGPQPLTGVSWWWHPTGSPPVPATTAPISGWTPLPPAGVAGTIEQFFIFPFDTLAHTPGLYGLTVELGNGAGTTVGSSAEVRLMCDNRPPTILNSIRWSRDSGMTWTLMPTDCPVVRRGVTPQDVLFEVTWNVMAPGLPTLAHYRNSAITAAGCGPSGPAPVLDPPGQTTSDWHTGPLDNAMTYVTTYRLAAGHAEGTYGFDCYAYSRAFNPSGYLAAYQAADWLSDAGAPIWTNSPRNFSVINAN